MTQKGARLDVQHPFLGLRPFSEAEQEYFKGRRREIKQLLSNIRRSTLTLLFGVSGLGKTSLLMAGVFPKARQQGFFPILVRFDYGKNVGDGPFQIKAAITDAINRSEVDADLPTEDESLWRYFHRAEFWSQRNELLIPVLIIDQLEELFTLAQDQQAVKALTAEIADLVENRIPPADQEHFATTEELPFLLDQQNYRVVLSIREDYLPELEGIRKIMPSIRNQRFRLRPMRGAAALEVVQQVPELIDRDVAEQVVRFVGAGNDDLPLEESLIEPALLSVFCRELNSRRLQAGEEKISAGLLKGSKDRILSDFYKDSVKQFPKGVRTYIEDQLLTAGGHRNSVALEDALLAEDITDDVIQGLIEERLIRIEERAGVERIELTHDLLTQVITRSRNRRQENERKEKESIALKKAQRKARQAQVKLRRDRLLFATFATMVLLAVLFAIWAFNSQTRHQKILDEAYSLHGEVMELEERIEVHGEERLQELGIAESLGSIRTALEGFEAYFVDYYLTEAALKQESDLINDPLEVDAIDLYERVLNADPENTEALDQLDQIAVEFQRQAYQEFTNGRHESAAELARAGLRAQGGEHAALQALHAEILDQLQGTALRLETLLSKAKELTSSGNLLPDLDAAPLAQQLEVDDVNDVHTAYSQVQDIDPGNAEAQAGLAGLQQRVHRHIVFLRSTNQLTKAEQLARRARDHYANDEDIEREYLTVDRMIKINEQVNPIEAQLAMPLTTDRIQDILADIDDLRTRYPTHLAAPRLRARLVNLSIGQADELSSDNNESAALGLLDAVLEHHPDHTVLQEKRHQIEDQLEARLEAESGKLVILSLPWSEVVSVCQSNNGAEIVCAGESAVLPGLPEVRSTPMVLRLPGGQYQVGLRGLQQAEVQTYSVQVNAGETIQLRKDPTPLSAEAYIQELGW